MHCEEACQGQRHRPGRGREGPQGGAVRQGPAGRAHRDRLPHGAVHAGRGDRRRHPAAGRARLAPVGRDGRPHRGDRRSGGHRRRRAGERRRHLGRGRGHRGRRCRVRVHLGRDRVRRFRAERHRAERHRSRWDRGERDRNRVRRERLRRRPGVQRLRRDDDAERGAGADAGARVTAGTGGRPRPGHRAVAAAHHDRADGGPDGDHDAVRCVDDQLHPHEHARRGERCGRSPRRRPHRRHPDRAGHPLRHPEPVHADRARPGRPRAPRRARPRGTRHADQRAADRTVGVLPSR